jgi:ankyrin repeat protein
MGCDLSAHAADGDTLLHIAAAAGDAPLVRYLLDQGLRASTVGQYGLPALGRAETEDVALMLLAAGTDLAPMNQYGGTFRQTAIGKHWDRVVAWLDAHDPTAGGAKTPGTDQPPPVQ